MTRKPLLLAFVLLLTLGGCTTKIAYNYAHWWANWAVDDYIALNREQKTFFKQQFRSLHQWHRQTQLPLYADFLNQFRSLLSSDISADTLHQQALKAQALVDNSKQQVAAPLAELLASLTEKQTEALVATLAKETESRLKKSRKKTIEKRRKQQQKSMAKFARKWLGSLNKGQRKDIESWSQATHLTAEQDAHQQQLWQQKFTAALDHNNPGDIKAFLERYLLDDQELWQEDYRKKIRHNQKITRELLADLLNSRSDKQRRHLDRKLTALAKDFSQLAVKVATAKPVAN
ncbi:MAG: DUF6279 family lipoprotein [Porticoccaceae bacterium]|nr:DUF6279 family lipoprotein [Porticoccaceae bacterium]